MEQGYGSAAANHSQEVERRRAASASAGDAVGSVGRYEQPHLRQAGCNISASATLTYDYGHRTAWVERLDVEAHPMSYDLCAAHADGMRVPQGWALQDRRVRYPAALPQSIAS